MELQGKEVVARTLADPSWHAEDGGLLLTEQCVRDDWTWVDNRLIFLVDGARQDFVLSHRLYSGAELRSLLITAGFVSVTLFGGLDGSAYDARAETLVAVARA